MINELELRNKIFNRIGELMQWPTRLNNVGWVQILIPENHIPRPMRISVKFKWTPHRKHAQTHVIRIERGFLKARRYREVRCDGKTGEFSPDDFKAKYEEIKALEIA